MNKFIISICAAIGALCAPAVYAIPADIKVLPANVTVERSENILFVGTDIDLSNIKRDSNRELWITPVVVNGADSVALPTVVVAGRNRYYQALRHDLVQRENITLLRASSSLTSYPYKTQVDYQPWMNGADVVLCLDTRGCCEDMISAERVPMQHLNFEPKRFEATFNWIAPQAEAVKTRELRGQAFIDFPVNKTEIYPDYRRNTVELAKIRATIDSVHNDPDITITALSIKGYASPEGSYSNNERLAKGRTAALKGYVEQLYHFAPDFIATSYDPEDWGGLRAYVEKSDIPNRAGILSIIDSDMQPDPKNEKIRRTYPEQYAFLLANVYPALRHSDYRIEYTIRSYTDPVEIRRLVKTAPQKLSLQEFFTAANSLDPSDPEYGDIFETAVRMFPQSEVANLNAANALMRRGDLEGAARYLANAGDGPEAIYARGVLAALKGDYAAARQFFQQAARLKVADAPAALEQINEIEKSN